MNSEQKHTAARPWWHAAILAVLLVTSGCGYGEVSPATYDYAKALYSLTNRKATDRIESVAEQIAAAEAEGELSSKEAGWLNAILDDARAGNWKAANQASRRIMEDQVRPK